MHPSPYPTHPQPAPALHLLAGLWVASCPACAKPLTVGVLHRVGPAWAWVHRERIRLRPAS